MKVLYYDCFSGISGDMNLAAMINLGVDEQYLKDELAKLGLTGYEIQVSRASRHSISGTRVDVLDLLEEERRPSHEHQKNHSHPPDQEYGEVTQHEADHHSHKGAKGHSHEPSHEHRNLERINAILDESSLSQRVTDMSKRMFRLIAEAEAKVHGTTVEKIHFHEVGALDSIIDIVGAAICFDFLNVDKIISSSVELGGGFVKCAHGMMPVPAPATAEILSYIPVKTGAVDKETTTPTGAAILAANVDEYTDLNMMEIEKIGYGIGHRELEIPNILRLYLGNISKTKRQGYYTRTAMEISCNIDDMNPEHFGHVMDLLFSAGADEVYITPVMMKKTRPASKLSILCKPGLEENINHILFTHTSTLGVRRTMLEKSEMKREFEKMNTRYGQINVKIGYLEGNPVKYKPEYEDCCKIAEEHNLSVQEVYQRIMNDIRHYL